MAMNDDFKNAIVYGISQLDLVTYLTSIKVKALVSETINSCTAFYPKAWSEIGPFSIPNLVPDASKTFDTFILTLEVFNAFVFKYELCQQGLVTDQYNSFPNYADPVEIILDDENDAKMHAHKLCQAFDAQTSINSVTNILNKPAQFDSAARHCYALTNALNIPNSFIGLSYFLLEDNADTSNRDVAIKFVATTPEEFESLSELDPWT